jgi:hypothetical protein
MTSARRFFELCFFSASFVVAGSAHAQAVRSPTGPLEPADGGRPALPPNTPCGHGTYPLAGTETLSSGASTPPTYGASPCKDANDNDETWRRPTREALGALSFRYEGGSTKALGLGYDVVHYVVRPERHYGTVRWLCLGIDGRRYFGEDVRALGAFVTGRAAIATFVLGVSGELSIGVVHRDSVTTPAISSGIFYSFLGYADVGVQYNAMLPRPEPDWLPVAQFALRVHAPVMTFASW